MSPMGKGPANKGALGEFDTDHTIDNSAGLF
jgi:hypothetical protein